MKAPPNTSLKKQIPSSLWSVGLGLDAVLNEDIRASLGYGMALRDVTLSTESIETGDGEFYFQLSYSF